MTKRGGRREGAGRPAGQGKYGEPTQSIRVPVSRVEDIKRFINRQPSKHSLPLYSSKVPAGFPSPGEDHVERYLDLNDQLIKHPSATFFVTASGDSMTDAGIHSGDMLIVDRSIEATHGKIVIAAINGELTVKRLSKLEGKLQLLPANPKYKPIDITDNHDLVIWGVVTHVVHTPE
ncbi:MAG: LexA family protein [Gammaproteobacteria bacterium]